MPEQRKSARRKEKQREAFNKLTTTPIPYPLALARVRKRANSEGDPGNRGRKAF